MVETPDGGGHFEDVVLRPVVTVAEASSARRARARGAPACPRQFRRTSPRVVANVQTGAFWGSHPTAAQLAAYLERGNLDAGPPPDWSVGHFVGLVGLRGSRRRTAVVAVVSRDRSAGRRCVTAPPIARSQPAASQKRGRAADRRAAPGDGLGPKRLAAVLGWPRGDELARAAPARHLAAARQRRACRPIATSTPLLVELVDFDIEQLRASLAGWQVRARRDRRQTQSPMPAGATCTWPSTTTRPMPCAQAAPVHRPAPMRSAFLRVRVRALCRARHPRASDHERQRLLLRRQRHPPRRPTRTVCTHIRTRPYTPTHQLQSRSARRHPATRMDLRLRLAHEQSSRSRSRRSVGRFGTLHDPAGRR